MSDEDIEIPSTVGSGIPDPPTPPKNRQVSTGSRWIGYSILIQYFIILGLLAYLNIAGVI
jgi:hypothetical protein